MSDETTSETPETESDGDITDAADTVIAPEDPPLSTDENQPDEGSSNASKRDLDTRERRLDEREMGLDKRAEDLDERRERLDERDQALNGREQKLDEREEDLTDFRQELQNEESRLNHREAELKERSANLDEFEDDLTDRQIELGEHEEILHYYLEDQFEDVERNIEKTLWSVLDNHQETLEGQFGRPGNLLIGLTGLLLAVAGVGYGALAEFDASLVLFTAEIPNLTIAGVLLTAGFAINLIAVVNRI